MRIQLDDYFMKIAETVAQRATCPRKSVGVKIFSNPMIQLGDIVTINYQTPDDSTNVLSNTSDRFVVYYVDYDRDNQGPTMTLYLSEVV